SARRRRRVRARTPHGRPGAAPARGRTLIRLQRQGVKPMNTKILATALLAATVGTVVLYPTLRGNAAPQGLPPLPPVTATAAQVEAVFVLDTTGSMSGLIDAAKEKIWSIAATMAQADPAPQIRI